MEATGVQNSTRLWHKHGMARDWREERTRPPLDEAALERLALAYVGRYATTRAKLGNYLLRKLAGRDWSGAGEPPVAAIVARMAEAGYIDDRGFAEARSAALGRRGYGRRRVAAALDAAGIAPADQHDALDLDETEVRAAALAFARRRRLGPYAEERAEGPARDKAIAAFLRAGHDFALARAIISAQPGEFLDL